LNKEGPAGEGSAAALPALLGPAVMVLGLDPSSDVSEALGVLPASGRAAVSGLSVIVVRSIDLFSYA
jgi:hypothetical protein